MSQPPSQPLPEVTDMSTHTLHGNGGGGGRRETEAPGVKAQVVRVTSPHRRGRAALYPAAGPGRTAALRGSAAASPPAPRRPLPALPPAPARRPPPALTCRRPPRRRRRRVAAASLLTWRPPGCYGTASHTHTRTRRAQKNGGKMERAERPEGGKTVRRWGMGEGFDAAEGK